MFHSYYQGRNLFCGDGNQGRCKNHSLKDITDSWMKKSMDRRTDRSRDELADGWRNKLTEGQTDKLIN